MEKNIQIVVVTIGVLTIVGGIYFCIQKLKQLQTLQIQTQKHLMYQQNILEKHNNILQTLTIGQNANGTPSIPSTASTIPVLDPILGSPPPLQPTPPSQNAPQTPPAQNAPPNPMANILPMLSTIMGMMNSEDNEHEEDSLEDPEETERRKTEMSAEIEKELQELQTETIPEETVHKTEFQEKTREGRVEEEVPKEEVTM